MILRILTSLYNVELKQAEASAYFTSKQSLLLPSKCHIASNTNTTKTVFDEGNENGASDVFIMTRKR